MRSPWKVRQPDEPLVSYSDYRRWLTEETERQLFWRWTAPRYLVALVAVVLVLFLK